MSKTLRVCLAMGGGVSLGSFSGSALTEALKLLILYGRDAQNKPYKKIIVDGISGASAGAIALTIMLRCLIDYKSMLPKINKTEEDLLQNIADAYYEGDTNKAQSFEEIEALKALELAQLIQKELWVKKVTIEDLYGERIKTKAYEYNDSFGLLDRDHLIELTRDFLMTPITNKDAIQVLDTNRIVFACSLTNLLPIDVIKYSNNKSKLEKNVMKSIGSQNHTELRIIDFVFNEDEKKPTDHRWLKFSRANTNDNPMHFNVYSNEAWAEFAASAIACGAFPIAFEPVMLRRFKKEFDLKDKQDGDKEIDTYWPKAYTDILNETKEEVSKHNVFFNTANKENEVDYESFNFPYMDGGTFNNEPIKEAFKLGSFQDYGRDSELEHEERLVLFVDPIVRVNEHHPFEQNSYKPIKQKERKSEFNKEFDKFIGAVSSIANVLRNQGNIKEEQKINDVRENLHLRTTFEAYLDENTFKDRIDARLLTEAFNKIDKNLKYHPISIGTRSPIIYFLNELQKKCSNNTGEDICSVINKEKLKALKAEIDKAVQLSNTDKGALLKSMNTNYIYTFLEIQDNESAQETFAKTVFNIIIDFSLNTQGKKLEATRAAILPINKHLETLRLPGEEIAAFAGFGSERARDYAFDFARLSTFYALREEKHGFREGKAFIVPTNNFIETYYEEQINNTGFYKERRKYISELQKELISLSIKRIKKILTPLIKSLKWRRYIPLNINIIYFIIKKALPKLGKNAINDLNYISLSKVTLAVLSNDKEPRKLSVYTANGRVIYKAVIEEVKINGRKRYKHYFQLNLATYISEVEENEIIPSAQFSPMFKTSPTLIDNIKIVTKEKIQIPNTIDPNLKPLKMRRAIEQQYEGFVEKIQIGNTSLPSLNEQLENKNQMLFYALKNIHYHINPIIEIDLQNVDEGWYFIENTKALNKKILEGNA